MFEYMRAQYFPAQLAPDIRAEPVDQAGEFWAVVEPLLTLVFPPFSSIGAYEPPPEQAAAGAALARVFASTHHERFIIWNEHNEAAGWSYGEIRDRETFFMTNTALLPPYRQRGIYSQFTRRLLAYLRRLGYARVVSNHQTNNRAVIIAKLKLGFNVTAVNLDERWGAQVELTYLFADDRRAGYERAFALEPRPTPVSHQPAYSAIKQGG